MLLLTSQKKKTKQKTNNKKTSLFPPAFGIVLACSYMKL